MSQLHNLVERIRQKICPKKYERDYRDFPFGRSPQADVQTYKELHRIACLQEAAEIDAYEQSIHVAIDRDWMFNLAQHTQAVIKQSALNYQHGRILYSTLHNYLTKQMTSEDQVLILETGTARGFSTMCMAKALSDTHRKGHIITVDILPHNTSIYWNIIDDHEGPKTRQELLVAYRQLLEYVVFLEGDTRTMLNRLGAERINFAFLDAQHTYEDVMIEFNEVSSHQISNDMIIFDDVTPDLFPGVVEAVKEISLGRQYRVETLKSSEQRGYAIAIKN